MENRWSDRRELNLGVDIFSAGEKLTSCSCQNIGLGGTCLRLDGGRELRSDQEVELVFRVPQGDRETKYAILSKVVWQNNQDIGLKFQEHNTSVFRSLQELINYRPS